MILGLYGLVCRAINPGVAIFLLIMSFGTTQAARAETILLALGDSLTAGYGLSKQDSFPSQLEAALKAAGQDVRVVNGGVSGDTSKAGLSRVDWLFAEKPNALIVELGANDGLRGLDPAQTEANLAGILEKAQAEGIPVLLTGMLAPPNLGREYGEEFNAVYPTLAERYGTFFYPFFLEGVAAEPDLNLGDGMHPNADGVAVIVERIMPIVLDLLASSSS